VSGWYDSLCVVKQNEMRNYPCCKHCEVDV
jgi:hypothetical protein